VGILRRKTTKIKKTKTKNTTCQDKLTQAELNLGAQKARRCEVQGLGFKFRVQGLGFRV
jgi:hypothetical protein